jgi:hypothetical protein
MGCRRSIRRRFGVRRKAAGSTRRSDQSGQQVSTPQPDQPCSQSLAGAMARLADGKTTLVCTDQGEGFQWTVVSSPYPLSERWLSYCPELQLHGPGMRNPEIVSGRWTGYPQAADAVCRAEQVEVMGPGKVSPPESATGEPGNHSSSASRQRFSPSG